MIIHIRAGFSKSDPKTHLQANQMIYIRPAMPSRKIITMNFNLETMNAASSTKVALPPTKDVHVLSLASK